MMFVYAADERLQLIPQTRRVRWGNIEQDVVVHESQVTRPNESFDETLKAEVRQLPLIAFLAYQGALELLYHHEARMELWGARNPNDPRGPFYGAPITSIPDPLPYGRIVLSRSLDPLPPVAAKKDMSKVRHRQIAFMAGIDHPRFVQLRKACGADTAKGIDPAQLADAFHLWSAEMVGASHFLTAERKLLNLARDPVLKLGCRPVTASEIVAIVCPSRLGLLYMRAKHRLDEWLHPERWHVAA